MVPEQVAQPALRHPGQVDAPGAAGPSSAELFDQDIPLLA